MLGGTGRHVEINLTRTTVLESLNQLHFITVIMYRVKASEEHVEHTENATTFPVT